MFKYPINIDYSKNVVSSLIFFAQLTSLTNISLLLHSTLTQGEARRPCHGLQDFGIYIVPALRASLIVASRGEAICARDPTILSVS